MDGRANSILYATENLHHVEFGYSARLNEAELGMEKVR